MNSTYLDRLAVFFLDTVHRTTDAKGAILLLVDDPALADKLIGNFRAVEELKPDTYRKLLTPEDGNHTLRKWINVRLPLRYRDVDFAFACAHSHGQTDEPDHEVGDLQDLFRVAWGLLSNEQRLAFWAKTEVRETVSVALALDESEMKHLVEVGG